MNAYVIDQWISIIRDLSIVILGAFILVYETVFVVNPNYLLVGAGLALLGVPPALRADQFRRDKRSVGDEDEERWTHLP